MNAGADRGAEEAPHAVAFGALKLNRADWGHSLPCVAAAMAMGLAVDVALVALILSLKCCLGVG
ncbi:MAG: hypothetical protein ROR55_19875 [Devosia sp.]